MNNLPANLPNIAEIEAGLRLSMELYETAFQKIADAEKAIKAAYAEIQRVTPGADFRAPSDAQEVKEFHDAVRLPDQELYLRTARKMTNLRCWHYVVDRCGLQQLMDAQAKRELEDQLRYVPEKPKHRGELITGEEIEKGAPPFTVENVRATIARFSADAQTIWRRGIANAFSALDRRFRSHDGFKVGSRVILTGLVSSYGHIEWHGERADTFRDIERTFWILDGRDPRHARSDMLQAIRDNHSCLRPTQSCTENEYLRVRVYKNRNAHLWFLRDDLVELVNKELAAYYGEVIGDGQTKEPDPLENRALTPARAFGFYPTSNALAEKIADHIPYREGTQRILEPSAGTGNLAFAALKIPEYHEKKGCRRIIDAVEIQPKLALMLKQSGRFNSVTNADFLKMSPTPVYDGVLMNPPFDHERDVDHFTHALKFLKPNGWLMSIMSAGTEFRETRKAAAFRKLVADRKGWMIDLPAGSFADVGTCVNTILVGMGPDWRYPLYRL